MKQKVAIAIFCFMFFLYLQFLARLLLRWALVFAKCIISVPGSAGAHRDWHFFKKN